MNYLSNFMLKKRNKLITHNGSFHADDIFSTALFSILFEKLGESFEIIRTRDEKIIETGDYVFDVGGIYNAEKNRFDHHQVGGAGKRENGIDRSSFGLVWEKFGSEICGGKETADLIDRKLVTPIDASDNAFDLVESKYDIMPYFVENIFFAMEPTWSEENLNRDEVFLKCVEIAKTILLREIVHAQSIVSAEDAIGDAYKNAIDKRIIVLDKNYPFEYILYNFPEPLFAVYPRKIDNSWGVKAIRDDIKSFKNRKNFPKSWGGLREDELQEITGVSDAIFCHHSLYLAGAKSKEGAIKLAQIAIE